MHLDVFAFAGIGFVVGLRHAFEPDHLAAVSTLASRSGWRGASRLGIAWGVGHTASVGLVAMVITGLGVRVPDRVFHAAELLVATLLVALGVSTLVVEARRHRRRHGRPHQMAHAHLHRHSHANVRTIRGAFLFGIAHGLAGSGAVIVLIVAATSNAGAQWIYLLLFGVGTMCGMTLVSLVTGAVAGAATVRSHRVGVVMRVSAAAASTVVGVWLGAGVLA